MTREDFLKLLRSIPQDIKKLEQVETSLTNIYIDNCYTNSAGSGVNVQGSRTSDAVHNTFLVIEDFKEPLEQEKKRLNNIIKEKKAKVIKIMTPLINQKKGADLYQVLFLRFVKGLTIEYTAEIMECSIRSINNLTADALETLFITE